MSVRSVAGSDLASPSTSQPPPRSSPTDRPTRADSVSRLPNLFMWPFAVLANCNYAKFMALLSLSPSALSSKPTTKSPSSSAFAALLLDGIGDEAPKRRRRANSGGEISVGGDGLGNRPTDPTDTQGLRDQPTRDRLPS